MSKSQELKHPENHVLHFLTLVLGSEKNLYWLMIVYGLGIGILSLSMPIAVQSLMNSLIYTALTQPIIALSVVLLVVLTFLGVLKGLQFYTMEIFGRKFMVKITSEMTKTILYKKAGCIESLQSDKNSEIFNRYFDIVKVQKSIPYLLFGGLSLALQTFLGLIIVSFYHPIFLAFNLILVLAIALVWQIYYKPAMKYAFKESHTKYSIAAYMQGLARSQDLFLGAKQKLFTIEGVSNRIQSYLECRKKYHRNLFAQIIFGLIIYAVSSAALLAIGGLLILKNQLTVGQLVASEIILSSVLYGLSKFGTFLDAFYDLCVACEEIDIMLKSQEITGKIINDLELEKINTNNQLVSLAQQINLNDELLSISSNSFCAGKIYNMQLSRNQQSSFVILAESGFDKCSNTYILKRPAIDFSRDEIGELVAVVHNLNLPHMLLREVVNINSVSNSQLNKVMDTFDFNKSILNHKDASGKEVFIDQLFLDCEIEQILQCKIMLQIMQGKKIIIVSAFGNMLPNTFLQKLSDLCKEIKICVILLRTDKESALGLHQNEITAFNVNNFKVEKLYD